MSEAQRQFLKAFRSLVSSVSSVQISLSACTVHRTVKVGGEWGGTAGLGVDGREWFPNTGEYFSFLCSGGGLGTREEITILLTNSPSLPVDVS